MRVRGRAPGHAGFTLVETLMVVAIGLILMAITAVNVGYVVEQTRGDSALYTVMSQLRRARDLAISRRRNVLVLFVMPNELRVFRQEISGELTLVNQVFLEGTVRFEQFSGVPDTPDAFGADGAIDFQGKSPTFTPDGQVVDTTDAAPLSGTVFLGIPGEPASARAVSVFGGTGQIRGYTYDWANTTWVEQ